ncbi:hypothetical protein [Amycolatopsis sp. RTGN1]|uniref:hypothetical protein n=1 Tax=Amycolatopsis ponsaeliensis TaxID=2992142 RepID=UPI00254D6675|nr:hypothetical protein [Amycolatopsis sp. RTGN1]
MPSPPDYAETTPPIPAALADLPVLSGLIVPWVTPRTADGRYLLGAVDAAKTHTAIHRRLCGVCGRALADRLVLLVRESDLARCASTEPGLHPHCAAYTTTACPMVAGRRSHYRTSAHKIDEDAVHGADVDRRLGAPAERWHAVWLTRYDVVTLHGHPAACYLLTPPLRIRPVSASPRNRI